jgi:hypothetical protein
MAYPTPVQIDAAVPVDGKPSRALTNTALKDIVGAASYLPTDGSVPTRSVANENFTGGRIKAAPGTDPDDVPVMVQLPSFARRSVVAKPETPESSGAKGDYYMDDEAIYFCIAANTWRMIVLSGWE